MFLDVVESVDDGVDAGGEIVDAAAELVVAGERSSFVSEAGSLVLQLFRRAATSVARRCISGSSINPPW
ncbi:hypothetical protein [Mycolicibacterium celeriflavum]|uniref:hypothetical protein n=1 Tax=Mycolicibacterium celeriflavum TaxID=1249101 RepID=UPI0013D354F6